MLAYVMLIVVGTLLISLGLSAILQRFVGHIVKKFTDDPIFLFFVSTVAIMLGLVLFVIGLMGLMPIATLLI